MQQKCHTFDYTIQSKCVYQKAVEFLGMGKICQNNDNETHHTIFPGNIFSEAIEDVNIYKSIILY